MSVTNLAWYGRTVFIAPDGHSVDNTRRSEMLVKNSNVFLLHLHSTPQLWVPHRNIAIRFGMEKLGLWGYLMVKKLRIQLVVLTQYMNVADSKMDRQQTD